MIVIVKYSKTELGQLVCHRVSFPEGERVYPRIRIRMLIPPKITYTTLPLPPLKKET